MVIYSMPELINQLTVLASAKVNLHLAVKNKRPDGFHNLESIFLAINFGDILRFQLNDTEFGVNDDNCEVEGAGELIPDNIIVRAVSLFRAETGFSHGLTIKVQKRIPIGGGLGGGSSDAAATLIALNKMTGSTVSRETLLRMGKILGSDVPFFLYETPAAWVTGRGEYIKPVDMPPLFLVLVNPGFSSNTVTAFRLLDEYRKQETIKAEIKHEGLEMNNFLSVIPYASFYNDFLPVFPEKERSVYCKIIKQLQELGAQYANLSGAGSTCFGVFANSEQADKAAEILRCKWGFVESCCSYEI